MDSEVVIGLSFERSLKQTDQSKGSLPGALAGIDSCVVCVYCALPSIQFKKTGLSKVPVKHMGAAPALPGQVCSGIWASESLPGHVRLFVKP